MNDVELLGKKAWVDAFLNKGPRPLSSYSFVSLFAWCDFFDFEFKIINNGLCIFAHSGPGRFLYLPPLGINLDLPAIQAVFEHMAADGAVKPVNRIENIPGNLLSAFGPDRYNQYRKAPEYVYRKDDLACLKGNAYKSQRHDCNVFLKHHQSYAFEAYAEEDFDACLSLYNRWAQHRARSNSDEIYRSMLEENRKVHARLLKYWKNLGLVARVLKVDRGIVGYTFGFFLDEKTFCVYAEIADLGVTGAAAFMFKKLCSDGQLSNINRINTMDDFAMPKVAQAKMAYHPLELVPSYSITLKKDVAHEY